MEDFFPALIIIIGIVGSIVSSASKEKKRKADEERRRAAAARKINVQKAPAKAEPHPYAPLSVQPVSVSSLSFGDVPGQLATPTVHPHLQPDCATHDVPGSLGVTSMEGKDPCHEDQLTMERTIAGTPAPVARLSFNWTGDSMVKAVVMQEVLTRPANRAPAYPRRGQ